MWCWCLFRVSLIWVPLMLWWCRTGKAWFTSPSSSLSSTVCSKGKMWHHNPQCIQHHVLHVFSESFWLSLLMFCVHRKSYRSLGLLWAGSSIAHQIVLIPGVVIGESCLHERFDSSHHLCCLWLFFYVGDVLVLAGKYGSNIRPAFWRNVPFFLVPFWAAYLLFSRPREMPIVTADKVSFSSEDVHILCIE